MAERYEQESYAELPVTKEEGWLNRNGDWLYQKFHPEAAERQRAEDIRERNGEVEYGNDVAQVFDFASTVYGYIPILGLGGKWGSKGLAELSERTFNGEEYGQKMEQAEARKNNEVLAEGTIQRMTDKKPEDFVNELHSMTEVMDNGGSTQLTEDIGFAVNHSTKSYPVRTGEAIARFSDDAKVKIAAMYEAGSDEYNKFMEDLSKVNKKLTSDYYGSLMDMEKTGQRLTLEEKGVIDTLNIEGVKTKYSEYIPGQDVSLEMGSEESVARSNEHTLQIETAAGRQSENEIREIGAARQINNDALNRLWYGRQNEDISLKRSDGSFVNIQKFVLEPGGEVQNTAGGEARLTAKMNAEADLFRNDDELNQLADTRKFELGKKFDEVRGMRYKRLQTDAPTPYEAKATDKATANGYLNVFADIQAYNDEAARAITEQFKNNDTGRQAASNGLAKVVGAMTTEAYTNLKADNDKMNFLSDEDKKALDSLKLTGVNVKFSDFEEGMDVTTGRKPFDLGDSIQSAVQKGKAWFKDAFLDKEEDELNKGAPVTEDEKSNADFDFGSEMSEEEMKSLGEFADADKGNDVFSSNKGENKSTPKVDVDKSSVRAPKTVPEKTAGDDDFQME